MVAKMRNKIQVVYRTYARKLLRKWLEFCYRDQEEDICCCGEEMGKGGSICHHGGCRSMKEYVIDCEVDRKIPMLRSKEDADAAAEIIRRIR